jgi:DNA transformation protein
MARPDSFAAFVLDQLSRLDGMEPRPMFGGHGLYRGGTCFGILYEGRLYFKTDAESRADYDASGMKPFRPRAASRGRPAQTLWSYYEVPVEVLEDDDQLAAWAERAVLAARRAASSRTPRRRARG